MENPFSVPRKSAWGARISIAGVREADRMGGLNTLSSRSAPFFRSGAGRVRRAVRGDLDALMALEAVCFPAHRRADRRSLRRALAADSQEVWVVSGPGGGVQGAMVLFVYAHALRVYSVAVLPAARGGGAGGRLLALARALARRRGKKRITLEADAVDEKLLGWYAVRGFRVMETLRDYYAPGEDAVRMCLTLSPSPRRC